MDENENGPNGFWCSFGGFSITVNGFNTIFKSCGFYNMVKAVSFLINTIYWLKGKQSEWFDNDIDAQELLISFGLEENFKIKNYNKNEIALSYFTENQKIKLQRGNHFFDNVILEKQEWIDAVSIAVDEYFKILSKIINSNAINNTSKIMSEYFNVWQNINEY